jgi:hypothetical protein
MSCSRREAKRRLTARYYAALSELPPGTEPLFALGHFLSDENIGVVQRLDLYRDYSDQDRDRRIIDAWCRRDEGRHQ